ncbi:MAG: OmpA family protein [Desulfovibrionales bacterium]|nr:OmpA family protein [Desulfovibrionales bacterium]
MLDELGLENDALMDQEIISPSWQLSLYRVLNVYRYLLEQNVDPDSIRLEAFGKYWPRYSNRTEQGRKNNRRVEIILDKRNPEWIQARVNESGMPAPEDQGSYIYRDFIFDVGPEETPDP